MLFSSATRGEVGCALAASPALVPMSLASPTRTTAGSTLLWLATVGIDPDDLNRAISEHVDGLAREGDTLLYAEGLRLLKEHLDADDRVAIVTGCAIDVAAPLCHALGLRGVRVIGSTLARWRGGWIAREHCVGERKVEMLAHAGITPPWSFVYTDSASDLPLLRLAERRCLVNPSSSAVRRVRRELGPHRFDTLRWL